MRLVHSSIGKFFGYFIFYCQFVWSRALEPDLYNSPCPETFRYQMGPDGELYGTIGAYSFDENVITLSVDFSVANDVNNYNGRLELAYTKEQAKNDILQQRPVMYKLSFPRWENIPPRITKISVNGQVVCTGPKISLGGWISILTNINLQHTLTIRTVPLQAKSNPFVEPPRRKENRPFNADSKDFNVNFRPERPKDSLMSNPFFNSLRSTTSTTSTTTERISFNSISDNKLDLSKNPFLNGNVPVPQYHKSTASTVPRKDSTVPRESQTPVRVDSVPPSSFEDICGLPVIPVTLVVNGNSVPRGAFPWLVAMFSVTSTGLDYQCSGSLISKKHVITAAHCVEKGSKRIRADKLIFVLGKINIKRFVLREGEKMIEAEDIKVHPDYKPLSADADLAIATLTEEVEFTRYIRPICLWTETDDLDVVVGEKGKVVGWGRDEYNNTVTAEPRQTSAPIVSQEQCLRSSDAFRFVTSYRTFCAGERNGSGPCNGDSGSGFVMKRNGRWVLRGVVSISLATYDENQQNCDLSHYVVFTDISKFKDWVFSFLS